MKTTSFIELFKAHRIEKIEIPIIQRDYAQGRQDDIVPRIREIFLAVLHRALIGGEPVSLDFVYGEITNGKLTPLDGQQRLTTLFLLHWYIAARAGIEDDKCEFLQRFTYETRYSSRDFCLKLIEQRPTFPVDCLSDWIRDQSWFFSTWRLDPTVQSMLVMLDDIHDLFADSDCSLAWQRLADAENPAIVFFVLPIKDMGLTDDLYIKMNSRGKPLTEFEHFKANFEEIIRDASYDDYQEFICKIDNVWADLLWSLRGQDDIIDDEFMRYFRFITDILIHWTGVEVPQGLGESDIDRIAVLVYGCDNPAAAANRRFLFAALDCWVETDAATFFKNAFSADGHEPSKLTIFDSVNLFNACCKDYGKLEGRNRSFSMQRMLMLFAVLLHLTRQTEDFSSRIRTVRNLIFASTNEIRLENFPRLLEETHNIMVKGSLSQVASYNRKQVDEEQNKASFLSDHPDLQDALYRFEDHTLTRGCVAAIELDALSFVRRVTAFHEVFAENGQVPLQKVSAALLACGDYSQQFSLGRFQFGCNGRKEVWRQLFTNNSSKEFEATKDALMRLLDTLAKAKNGTASERLQKIVSTYIAEQDLAGQFDWRYYLVKYQAMREGKSGIYVGTDNAMGFGLCMLDKERMSSYYRDPYLFAVVMQSSIVPDNDVTDLWHTGYATEERWMTLVKNGIRLTCRRDGFGLSEPSSEAQRHAIAEVIAKHELDATLSLRIRQVRTDGVLYDTRDRVELGAALVRDLNAVTQT